MSFSPITRAGWLIAVLVIMLLAGCATRSETPPQPEPVSTAQPTAAPAAAPTADAGEPDGTEPRPLTVWLPAELVPGEMEGSYLDVAIQAFENQQSGRQVRIQPKGMTGAGGMLGLLLATYAAAPALMPDLALVDAADLPRLAEAGIAYPLDPYLPKDTWQVIYALALRKDQDHMAVPYLTDPLILAYDTASHATPPRSWAATMPGTSQMAFPAAVPVGDLSDAFMLQYTALGGIFNDGSTATLDLSKTGQVLRTLDAYITNKVVTASSLEMSTYQDCADALQRNQVNLAVLPYSVYRANRFSAGGVGIATVPTINGKPATLTRTLVWVVTTADAERRTLALDYLRLMLAPELAAQCAGECLLLPAQRQALELAVSDAQQRALFETLLATADTLPDGRAQQVIRPLIGQAVDGVLRQQVSPEEATESLGKAIEAMR
ncbi:MAG: extracellular solute-binding protein [Chloroflexi bacterium]|nr:extracellular solute-binding protein [Chloroflexota bacterium]